MPPLDYPALHSGGVGWDAPGEVGTHFMGGAWGHMVQYEPLAVGSVFGEDGFYSQLTIPLSGVPFTSFSVFLAFP